MIRSPFLPATLAFSLLSAGATGQAFAEPSTRRSATASSAGGLSPPVRAFLEQRCTDCHNADNAKGDLDLASLPMDSSDGPALARWTRVSDRVRSGEMPPKNKTTVSAADRQAFLEALDRTLFDADSRREREQGRVLGRRLTRREFENTLGDLLGTPMPLADLLPEDPRNFEFDTVAAGQDVSPQLLERYQEAAEKALDAAIGRSLRDEPPWTLQKLPTEFGRKKTGLSAREPIPRGTADAVAYKTTLGFHGRIPSVEAPDDGWYRLTVNAFAVNPSANGTIWASLQRGECSPSDPSLFWIASICAEAEPKDFVYDVWMRASDELELRPADNTRKNGNWTAQIDAGVADREGVAGIAIRRITLQKIASGLPRTALYARLFGDLRPGPDGRPRSDDPRADLPRLVLQFASRAYRRPATPDDVAGPVAIALQAFDSGADVLSSLRLGYHAVLASPRFLYLQERPGRLDDHALACRLSYMIWGTAPDDDLLAAATASRLSNPAELSRQLDRLLGDARSAAFINDFTDQWLKLYEIDATQPDAALYPEFDPILRHSMVDETRAFFREVLTQNLSVSTFVDSNFAMLDDRLANHYGLPNGTVGPGGIRRVPLRPEWHRGGLLTQASVLKVTANGTTTSPVLRGVWVLERLLGRHVPPPPANVPAVEPDIRGATTIRDQLAKHRTAEACASCHAQIDPAGFALESYDVSGGWRERYRVSGPGGKKFVSGPSVDPSYVTAEGDRFDDLAALKKLLLRQPEQVAHCLAEKLLVYGTGATASFADRKAIDDIVASTSADDFGLRSILRAVVLSDTFRGK